MTDTLNLHVNTTIMHSYYIVTHGRNSNEEFKFFQLILIQNDLGF